MNTELDVLAAQHTIQKKIAQQLPFNEICADIIDMVAQQLPSALVSYMQLNPEENTLSLVASNGLSDTYSQAVQDIPIGPTVASCGASAFLQDVVITQDIEQDSNWAFFREHTRREGVASCWSVPVVSEDQELLGTFATYYRYPKTPQPTEITILTQAAGLLALAILHQRHRHALLTAEQRYRSLFTQHPDAVYELDLSGRYVSSNQIMNEISGLLPEQLIGKHHLDLVVAQDHPRTQLAFEQACQGHAQHYEIDVCTASGESRRFEITNLPIVVNREIVGVYGIARDISSQHLQAEQLRLLKRGIEATSSGIIMVDASAPNLPIIYSNGAFYELTGYSTHEVIGHNCRFLQGPDTDPQAIAQIRAAIAEQREEQVTLLNYRKDGTPFWNQLKLTPVFTAKGVCSHFIGTQQDITHQREYEQRLRFKQTHDSLTGLLNWAGFELELNQQLQYLQQEQCITVLAINLDGFKSINNGLSHHVGDCLLKAVAERITAWLQPSEVLARLGGDDFCLLLPEREENSIRHTAESLLTLLSRPFIIYEHTLHISASIGIAASCKAQLHKGEELIQHANMAMREAKLQGQNTWQWYQGTASQWISDNIALRRDLQQAIETEQFILHYQPQVKSLTGEVQIVEALVRWAHPQRGLLAPGHFLPLAQQTGQIISIDQWVLRQACHDVVAINQERTTPLAVAVNIYPLLFRRNNFFLEVQQALTDSGLPPHLLELEVTEELLMSGTEQAIEQLEALRQLGVQVAIDDFGTGYSSLSYLRQLPITKVKLDRSFIQHIDHNRDNAAIVQGVITMAHHLGLQVVAEGVESWAEQHYLATLGCDLVQGFLFSHPLPQPALMALPTQFSIMNAQDE